MIRMRSMAMVALLVTSCGGNVVVDEKTGTGGGGTGAGGAAPAGNPLVGSWKGAAGGPTRLNETLTLNADGTATATDTFVVLGDGATMCSGALAVTDSWTSTATTFSVSGGTCTGSVSCPNGENVPCGPLETGAETCTYALSNGDDTLVLTCPNGNGPITYARE